MKLDPEWCVCKRSTEVVNALSRVQETFLPTFAGVCLVGLGSVGGGGATDITPTETVQQCKTWTPAKFARDHSNSIQWFNWALQDTRQVWEEQISEWIERWRERERREFRNWRREKKQALVYHQNATKLLILTHCTDITWGLCQPHSPFWKSNLYAQMIESVQALHLEFLPKMASNRKL